MSDLPPRSWDPRYLRVTARHRYTVAEARQPPLWSTVLTGASGQRPPPLAHLALATIIRRAEIRSLDADFPLAVPFTMVAGGPIRARVHARSTAK
jgi:hypothetical protein